MCAQKNDQQKMYAINKQKAIISSLLNNRNVDDECSYINIL